MIFAHNFVQIVRANLSAGAIAGGGYAPRFFDCGAAGAIAPVRSRRL